VAFTDAAKTAATDFGLQVAAVSEPFTVYYLPDSSLVEVGAFEPAVWDGEGPFVDAAIDWYDDLVGLDRWIVADGPEDWLRIDTVSNRTRKATEATGLVTDVVLEDERISFTTTAVGVPHLVKVSWFPNWTATGADGPYRAAPSLMIVVPRQEHVVLDFKDRAPETLGKIITLASVLGLATLAWRRRRSSDESPL